MTKRGRDAVPDFARLCTALETDPVFVAHRVAWGVLRQAKLNVKMLEMSIVTGQGDRATNIKEHNKQNLALAVHINNAQVTLLAVNRLQKYHDVLRCAGSMHDAEYTLRLRFPELF